MSQLSDNMQRRMVKWEELGRGEIQTCCQPFILLGLGVKWCWKVHCCSWEGGFLQWFMRISLSFPSMHSWDTGWYNCLVCVCAGEGAITACNHGNKANQMVGINIGSVFSPT